MYGSIFWWMVKLGLSAALAMSGYVLNATGFDVELGPDQSMRTLTLMRLADIGVPVVTSAIALWAVARFPITEAVANNVRRKLEERRGKV
jgi:GPH family glycoside/pentoside/hexuronide:cation symporter